MNRLFMTNSTDTNMRTYLRKNPGLNYLFLLRQGYITFSNVSAVMCVNNVSSAGLRRKQAAGRLYSPNIS